MLVKKSSFCGNDDKNDSWIFFAPSGFSGSEHERKRIDRHRRSMRTNPGWAMHEHVDLWRDVPRPDSS